MFRTAKVIASLAISTSLLSMPVVSHANALTITNKTAGPTTSRINGVFCSNILGPIGVTPADGVPHSIPDATVASACAFNPTACTAEVFEAADCNGPMIAKLVINVKSGVVSSVATGAYPIYAPVNGFEVVLG